MLSSATVLPGVVSMPVHADYTLSGQVVWVGRSSMDVLIEVGNPN